MMCAEPRSTLNPSKLMGRRAFAAGLASTGGGALFGCAAKTPLQRAPVRPSSASEEVRALYRDLEGYCEGVREIGPAELAENRLRLQRLMQAAEIDYFVAEAGTQMRFLSGVAWGQSERPLLLLLPREGEAYFVAPHFESKKLRAKLQEHRQESLEIRPWREHERAVEVLARGEAALRKRVLAVDPWMRNFIASPLSAFAGSVVPGDALVVQLRARKTDVEIERMRRANEATKAAIERAASNLHWGMRQSEFAEHLRAAQERAGLSRVWVLSLFGPNASFPHGTARDRPLSRGDVVLVDTGGALHGYQSDVSRSFALGPVHPRVERAAEAVYAAHGTAFDRVRAGLPCGAVDAAARKTLRERGYGGSDRWFTHRLGHGIGMQVHEAPYLVPHSEQRLEMDMTFSIEPGIYVPEDFGVRIEDIVVVGPEGAQALGPRSSMEDFYRG